jgi:hypothetical protein
MLAAILFLRLNLSTILSFMSWYQVYHPPAFTSRVPGITGVHQHTQYVWSMSSSESLWPLSREQLGDWQGTDTEQGMEAVVSYGLNPKAKVEFEINYFLLNRVPVVTWEMGLSSKLTIRPGR